MTRRRTVLAATLVAIAVLLPTSAWFFTGSAEARRRAAAVMAAADNAVLTTVQVRAIRLGDRLEALRAREAERPFYQYRSLYHDPRGASAGLSVIPSPLVEGAADPLVGSHFRVAPDGTVSLPTINEQFPELSTDADYHEFCSLLEDLRASVPLSDGPAIGGSGDARRVVLDADSWQQIRRADAVYATLTGRPPAAGAPAGSSASSRTRPGATVTIVVGPLRWETLLLPSGPSLTAIRRVDTPDGTELQGFNLAPQGITEWLAGDPPADLLPAPGTASDEILVAVDDTGWFVVADPAPARAAAMASADSIQAAFRRRFAISGLAALCAGAGVIFLVAQTDRLAHQRGHFAATAAHELKTPLASLRLHSEMLSEGLGDPAHSHRYADQIAVEVARLGRLVSNMLDVSRLERGASLASPVAGDAAAAVRRSLDRLAPSLRAEGVTLRTELESDLPPALVDADAVDQILANLLDNAEKYTRGAADRTVTVLVRRAADAVEVVVRDHGPGIPRALRHRLFRPYARAAGDAVPGLGLGLALARALAEAMGGTLTLDEDERLGASFVLTLRSAAGRD